jgi:hypothetical protein
VQVPGVAEHAAGDRQADLLTVRQRAFSALRELLARMAARQPLVLVIDDLHWADADSAALLDDLLRAPARPPILAVVCFRSEEIAIKPWLQSLVAHSGLDGCTTLPLGPVSSDDALAMIGAVVPPGATIDDDGRVEIARVAAGNPFLLEQLARAAAAGRLVPAAGAALEQLLGCRLADLPAPVRRFLQVLAVCGRPMDPAVVGRAAGLDGDERPAVAQLRAGHLLRSSGSAARVEVYHDRIREAVANGLSRDAARDVHGCVARTLEASEPDDPEALFEHWRGAGDAAKAAHHAVRAGHRAYAALAFDRAGFFFRAGLEDPAAASPSLLEALGEALTNAGRPAEAADVYLGAADVAEPSRRTELRRRAAEQLLVGGQIDRGLHVVESVLAAVRMRLAPGPRRALLSLLWNRLRLRWRGVDFTEPPDGISPDVALRLDTCWSIVTGLGLVDTVRASDFQVRHLLVALEAGDPSRLARALVIDAVWDVGSGGRHGRFAARRAAQAEALVRRLNAPHTLALAALVDGMLAMFQGRWQASTDHCDRALTVMQEAGITATWERHTAQVFHVGASLLRGNIRSAAARVPALLADARERGNLFLETELCTRMSFVWLAADAPDEGMRNADQAMARWSHQGFHRQHYNHALTRVQNALYRGDAEQAWRLMEAVWPMLRQTLLLRIRFLRIEASFLRARCALSMAAQRPGSARPFLARARRDARLLSRVGMAWPDALACLLGATIDHLDGRPRDAVRGLEAAVRAFDRLDMKLYAAAAGHALGHLVGGSRGQELRQGALAWMASEDIRHPGRVCRLMAPGFTEDE